MACNVLTDVQTLGRLQSAGG